MATTDQEILTRIQYQLVETPDGGATMSSGLWTVAELISAINNAQQWVTVEAAPLFTRTNLNAVPNEPRYPLPQDWLMTERVVWHDADGGKMDLPRDSSWSLDNLDNSWPYNLTPRPLTYTDYDAPMPMLQVMPAASDNGTLELTYVSVPTNLSNTGVLWTLPDFLVPMAMWKAIAILLAKDGRGQDLGRADAANKRSEEGLAALKILLKGWA